MNIFDEVDENLFRPLTGINKRKYVDILALIWDKCKRMPMYAIEKSTIFDMVEDYFYGLDEQVELDLEEQEEADGNFRLTYPSNFWDDISIPFWSMPENTDHPTQKPEKLSAKLILASSQKGDVVFDPFLGSGTSSVVAKKLGRNYCGIEMNQEYCLWTEKRLEMAEKDSTIQGYSDGVFWERNSLNQQGKNS